MVKSGKGKVVVANPFRPSTGASPPELIGRASLLDAIDEALGDGPGAPGRMSIFTGQRGVGKTVMLNEAAERAHLAGWRSIDLTATPGLMSRLDTALSRMLHEEVSEGRRVTGVSVAGLGGLTLEEGGPLAGDVRTRLTDLLEALASRGSGLMITVDEVQLGARADLRELGAIAQHAVREDRDLALAMAGLPAAVSGLLSDDVLTFLRRAERHVLEALVVDDVDDAFRKTFADEGRRLDHPFSRQAAEESQGYPFLVQLIGYHVWRQSTGTRVARAALEQGLGDARRRLGTQVHEPALHDLSEADRRFLGAMAEDDDRSAVAVLGRRLGKDKSHVNTYRRRLIHAQVIEPAGRGFVRFTLPYLAEHLREHPGGA